MGKFAGAAIFLLAAWASLANIWPDAFQLRGTTWVKPILWGRNTIWVAVAVGGLVLGSYTWNLEDRLASNAILHPNGATDETGIKFISWGPLGNEDGCMAGIDASNLSQELKDRFDLALVCGFADLAVDRVKDTRITVSGLFTPLPNLAISVPFNKNTADALAHEKELAIAKIQPRPVLNTPILIMNVLWMKTVLLPKGFNTNEIHRLADVVGPGRIAPAEAQVQVQVTQVVPGTKQEVVSPTQ